MDEKIKNEQTNEQTKNQTDSAELKIYNSLTRTKEVFHPLVDKKVKLYVCGPTVYDLLHIGNFRGPVFFNLVRQWFEHLGYQVTSALNFTDVDDKIIDRAKKLEISSQNLAEKYIEEYRKDYASLGLRPETLNPKVTETMVEIISFIEGLIKKGKAYEHGGDVLFSIRDFPEYGKLSGRKTDELQPAVQSDLGDSKKNPLDFALWKKAKAGEPSWESPWGAGRPGWHIECSAMISKHFGEQIDIHGGGLDLLFPHHENEVAQSESLSGKKFANFWMHWNMLNLTGAKMSKSLGNIISLREFLQVNHPEVYKWMILSVHYRSVLDFGEESLLRAVQGLGRVYSALAMAGEYLSSESEARNEKNEIPSTKGAGSAFQKNCDLNWQKVSESLNDDFNTPEAFAAMYDVIRTFNGQVKRGQASSPVIIEKARAFREFILKFGSLLSLFQEEPKQFLTILDDRLLAKMNLQREAVQSIVDERALARLQKDFAKSDVLRAKLTELGISVSDTTQGSFWEVTK